MTVSAAKTATITAVVALSCKKRAPPILSCFTIPCKKVKRLHGAAWIDLHNKNKSPLPNNAMIVVGQFEEKKMFEKFVNASIVAGSLKIIEVFLSLGRFHLTCFCHTP